MTLEIKKENDTMTGLLKGRLDNASVSSFSESIQPLMSYSNKRIVLDFSGLQFISLAGIRLIHSLQNATKNNGGQLLIRNVAVTVMQLMTATGFAAMFNFE